MDAPLVMKKNKTEHGITLMGASGAPVNIRFQDLIEWANDAMYCVNGAGVIAYANERFHQMLGYGHGEVLGKEILSLIYGEENVKLCREKLELRKKGVADCYNVVMEKKSGEPVLLRVSARPLKDVGGEFIGAIVTCSENGHQRRVEEELTFAKEELEEKVKERTRELEEINERLQHQFGENEKIRQELERQKDFLRLIIDADPNLIFVKDRAGKFIMANEAVARLYNMKPDEMLGHRDTEKDFSTGELQLFKEQDDSALAAPGGIRFPDQIATNKSTGETIWLQMVKKSIPSITGNDMNILGVGADITAIKEAKDELRKSEQLYREIARNLPKAAMFIFDKNLKYILAEGPLVGIISKPKNEIEGKSVTDAISEAERERVEQIYRNILEGEVSEQEQTFQERSLRVYHLPIHDEEGHIIYGMVMVFDISDLKGVQLELEKRATELQRSNEELERFAYVSSHDLQGPLRTIASYLQLLELRYKDKLDPEALEFIEFSVNGAKRMQQLILDLLNYSRLISVRKPFVLTDVNDVVKSVLKSLESSLKAAGAKVTTGHLDQVMAEPNHLYQLFQNLIDNALKFVKDRKPEIYISSVEREKEWEFMVKDNGIGIKEEYSEKVFRIFQRLHTVNEYPGTGVGLAICQKVVQLHGGRIWYTSTPGEGTTFHFTISKSPVTGK